MAVSAARGACRFFLCRGPAIAVAQNDVIGVAVAVTSRMHRARTCTAGKRAGARALARARARNSALGAHGTSVTQWGFLLAAAASCLVDFYTGAPDQGQHRFEMPPQGGRVPLVREAQALPLH
jgi:hypothetical protein